MRALTALSKRLLSTVCSVAVRALVFLVGCVPMVSAQAKPTAPPSPCGSTTAQAHAAQVQSAATAAKPGDFSQEALVFDQFHTRIRMESDGTGTRETTARIRVLADAGVKQMAVLTFTYTASNQQVDIAYVRVRKPDGTLVVTPDYNTQDMPADVTREAPMYSDIRQKHVAVKGLGVGDTLEYQLNLRTIKPEVPGQFWLEYSFEKNLIALDEQLDLDVPADKAVEVASADTQPSITTTSGRKLYRWASSNLARPDPDAPPKSMKHLKPSVQVTTFSSWEQVGAWYQSLQRGSLTVTPPIQAKADALTKGLTTDEDKVHAIFDDVALHIHYVGLDFGIGRYQPHHADDVLSNEYGDCKDKHTLLASLLKAAGIEAWPALISSSRELDPDTLSPAQFDHVITLVPLGGKLLWMDSTEEIAPIGTLIASLRDKQTLAIPVSKAAYLERTSQDLPFIQTARLDVTGKLSDQGQFTGHFNETYHGDVEMILRTAFRAVPQSQWKELLQQFSDAMGFGGQVKPPDVSPVEKTSDPFHISYDYTREKFGDWDNHRISPPMPAVGWELAPGVKQIKPADDIDIGSPGDQDYRATVQIPAGWNLFPPSNVDLKEDWAEYHSTYSIKDGVYTAERRLLTKKDKMPLDQWDKYLAFRRAIYDDEVRMTPITDASTPNVAALPLGHSGVDNHSGETRQQLSALVAPLRDALAILEAGTLSSNDEKAKAVEITRNAVDGIEEKTIGLPLDDPHSLYWAQALAYAWCTRGWAALESRDLTSAESYLRAAWRAGQDSLSGYQLGRVLQAQGNNTAAAHQYELAHSAGVANPLGGFLASNYNVEDHLAASYKSLTGKEFNSTPLNHGEYNGSLRAELDREQEIRPLTHVSKLTGSGLYAVAFESGKPIKVAYLKGDQGFGNMALTLQAHSFSQELPLHSKARLLREVRVICTPWAGCDAYILLPTSIEIPATNVFTYVSSPGEPKGSNTIRIEVAPQ